MRKCPFCGNDYITVGNEIDKYSGMYCTSYAECRKCGARGPVINKFDDEQAIKAWDAIETY